MKKPLMLVYFLLTVVYAAHAQISQTINYQGIARNSLGLPLGNQTIAVRISIRDAEVGSNALYSETKSVTTNAFGLYSIILNDGQGTVAGDFNNINWSQGPRFLQTEIDPTSGSNFQNVGTTLIHSAPTAIVAKTLEGVTNPQEGDRLEYRAGSWKRKAPKQYYRTFGAGANPQAAGGFIGRPISVVITNHEDQMIKAHMNKLVGSDADGGAHMLHLTIGYQKKIGTSANGTALYGPLMTFGHTPFPSGYHIYGMEVPKGTSVPVTLSMCFKVLEDGEFLVGMLGITGPGEQPNWNNNEGGISYVEVD